MRTEAVIGFARRLWRAAVARPARRIGSFLLGARSELLAGAAFVGGWALLTWGLASLIGVWQLWPLSSGFLLLSVGGWRMLGALAWHGLYALSRDDGGKRA